MVLLTVPLFEDSVVTEVESDARGLSGIRGGKKIKTRDKIQYIANRKLLQTQYTQPILCDGVQVKNDNIF